MSRTYIQLVQDLISSLLVKTFGQTEIPSPFTIYTIFDFGRVFFQQYIILVWIILDLPSITCWPEGLFSSRWVVPDQNKLQCGSLYARHYANSHKYGNITNLTLPPNSSSKLISHSNVLNGGKTSTFHAVRIDFLTLRW